MKRSGTDSRFSEDSQRHPTAINSDMHLVLHKIYFRTREQKHPMPSRIGAAYVRN